MRSNAFPRGGQPQSGVRGGAAAKRAAMQPNIQNRTIFTGTKEKDSDCLEVMRGLNTASIDLIYLDPPFNSKKNWDAPLGSAAAGAGFKDKWHYSDIKEEWWRHIKTGNRALYAVIEAAGMSGGMPNKAYMVYMGMRLLEMHRILKTTGSIYLHCDPVMSHSLKMAMDAIFGAENFRNEIIWCYSGGGVPKKAFARKHDVILAYAKSDASGFNLNAVRREYADSCSGRHSDGSKINKERGAHPNDWWIDLPPVNTQAKERTGYPTQKPLTLLERIIKASSNEGDIVLDPFCGCGTACDAAEKLGRRWIGIDAAWKAAQVILRERNWEVNCVKQIRIREGELPKRTDIKEFALAEKLNDKDALYGKQGGICEGCRVSYHKKDMTIDHIIPQSQGGQGDIENLQLLCSNCNSVKGAGTMDKLRAKLREKGII